MGSELIDRIARLEDENAALDKRIRLMESVLRAVSGAAAIVPRNSSFRPDRESVR